MALKPLRPLRLAFPKTLHFQFHTSRSIIHNITYGIPFQHFEIGSRGERHFLPGVYDTLRPNLSRKCLIYSRRLFEKHGFATASYLTQMETAKEGKRKRGERL